LRKAPKKQVTEKHRTQERDTLGGKEGNEKMGTRIAERKKRKKE
jgi:hypothetical protein